MAHFLNRILFCLFAQHAGLLPRDLVVRVLESGLSAPRETTRMLSDLFAAMKKGGPFGTHIIQWFNGNLGAARVELADEIYGALTALGR